MNKSLHHILEYSLVPALVLVLSKLGSVLLISKLDNLSWTFRDFSGDFFSAGTGISKENLEYVNSYSDMVMYLAITTFVSIMLFRATFLHNTHINPSLVAKLAKYNLLSLIKDTYELYHGAATNMIYLWISTVIILVNVVLDRTYLWIGITSVVVSISLTLILFTDVWKEIEAYHKK